MTQDWTTEQPEKFEEMTQVVARLISGDHFSLSRNVYSTARLIVAQLAHEHNFIWLNFNPVEAPEGYDWTTKERRANSSEHFTTCVNSIAGILEGNLLHLLTHNSVVLNTVSAQILTVMANLYSIVPPKPE